MADLLASMAPIAGALPHLSFGLPVLSLLSAKVPSGQGLGPVSGARALPKDRAELCYHLLTWPSCPPLAS